jgi:hypothetical protein
MVNLRIQFTKMVPAVYSFTVECGELQRNRSEVASNYQNARTTLMTAIQNKLYYYINNTIITY